MRKLVSGFFAIFIVAANFSTARANVVKISEIDAQKFIHSMTEIIYDENFQKALPLLLTNAEKIDNAEFPQISAAAWSCLYGLKNSTEPQGEILFFVDAQEKVFALKITSYSTQTKESPMVLLFMALRILGLTQEDANFLANNLSVEGAFATSSVWSAEINRRVILVVGERTQAAEGFQFLLLASDTKD